MAEYSAFFYGTLMSTQVLHRVIYNMPVLSKYHTDNIKISPAILHDHRRHRVRYADYPGVIPAAGSSVRGTYVTGLTSANINKLDLFEGSQYERRVVKPRLLKTAGDSATGKGNVEGEEVTAETYIWIAGTDELEDKEWDFAEFEREKMRYWATGHAYGEFEELEEAYAAQQYNSTDDSNSTNHTSQSLEADTEEATEGLQSGVSDQEAGSAEELIKSAV